MEAAGLGVTELIAEDISMAMTVEIQLKVYECIMPQVLHQK